ncbi:hypothetical protein BRD03_10800 [Halobacteriales archaeon QS_9_68_17]|nr:MAG: hypothetical protein BRD03_10800 [Halobacteriales archaeon QS_9_68_17]
MFGRLRSAGGDLPSVVVRSVRRPHRSTGREAPTSAARSIAPTPAVTPTKGPAAVTTATNL